MVIRLVYYNGADALFSAICGNRNPIAFALLEEAVKNLKDTSLEADDEPAVSRCGET